MNWTILLPHYKTGKMSAYCVHQLLKHKGRHEIEIIVIDNSQGEGIEYLWPYKDQIKILTYPADKMQSHGIAFDFAMPHVKTEQFITVESDSFPTQDNWLDYYEKLLDINISCAGSLLNLSGGQYIHPAGAMYQTRDWIEASKVKYPYTYFPNVSTKGEKLFAYHLMVYTEFAERFAFHPAFQNIDLHHSYKDLTKEQFLAKAEYYLPTTGVFHNGMGMAEEWLATYGQRNMESEPPQILPQDKGGIIHRVGYEPGQWFCYWLKATCRDIHAIPTEVVWLPNRENQQQEYTIMENGFKHLWAVTAYHDNTDADMLDISDKKRNQMNELWQSIQ